jgi:hypothetical protein
VTLDLGLLPGSTSSGLIADHTRARPAGRLSTRSVPRPFDPWPRHVHMGELGVRGGHRPVRDIHTPHIFPRIFWGDFLEMVSWVAR